MTLRTLRQSSLRPSLAERQSEDKQKSDTTLDKEMKGLTHIAIGLVAVSAFVGNVARGPTGGNGTNCWKLVQRGHNCNLEMAQSGGAGVGRLYSKSLRERLSPAAFLGPMAIIRLSAPHLEIGGHSIKSAVCLNPSAQNQYTASDLFSRLMEHRIWQQSHLDRFSVVRTYKVEDEKGKTFAKEVVVMEYKTPGTKTFTTTSANGSAFIRSHVFRQLMKREAGRAKGRQDRDSSITPDNYVFEILGQERIVGRDCTIVHAAPKRKETYLFEGKIWIDDQDFAIIKATGHLAKSPSFWIKRVDFVRQYQKIDGFWLPIKEQSTAKVRIFGTRILTIDYTRYTVNGVAGVEAPHSNSADIGQNRTDTTLLHWASANTRDR